MKLHNLKPHPCFTFVDGEFLPGALTHEGWRSHAYLGAEGELYGSASEEPSNPHAIVVVRVPTNHYSKLMVSPHVAPVKEEVVDQQTVATFLVEKDTRFTIVDQRESPVLFMPEQTYCFVFDGTSMTRSPTQANPKAKPLVWEMTKDFGLGVVDRASRSVIAFAKRGDP